MKDKELVIFGASGGGIKVAKTLINIGVDFQFFLDNDNKKWGNLVERKEVKSPQCLLEREYNIIIASDYYEEIVIQLSEMGIDESNIVVKEEYLFKFFNNVIENYTYLNNYKIKECNVKKRKYIIDIAEGMEIGGIESWSYLVAKALRCNGKDAYLFSKKTKTNPPEELFDSVKQFNMSYDRYKESVEELVDIMKVYLPFTILVSWMTQNYIAAYILKKYFPEDVSIIGVVHHDMVGYYKRNQFLNQYMDAFLCVSNDTRIKMIKRYQIDENKVYYKQVPVSYDNAFVKKFPNEKHPLQINFGSRLEKSKKRVDLIVPLIRKLEEKKVNYRMNIAGEGTYFDKINKFIHESGLVYKITLYGGLKYKKMKDFWKKGDIVISVSDSEGMGLSILEAMSYGEVPVVTKTAGIGDFVSTGVNGYICEINAIDEIVKAIQILDNDRRKLQEFSNVSRDIIRVKCSSWGYVEMISKIEKFIQSK